MRPVGVVQQHAQLPAARPLRQQAAGYKRAVRIVEKAPLLRRQLWKRPLIIKDPRYRREHRLDIHQHRESPAAYPVFRMQVAAAQGLHQRAGPAEAAVKQLRLGRGSDLIRPNIFAPAVAPAIYAVGDTEEILEPVSDQRPEPQFYSAVAGLIHEPPSPGAYNAGAPAVKVQVAGASPELHHRSEVLSPEKTAAYLRPVPSESCEKLEARLREELRPAVQQSPQRGIFFKDTPAARPLQLTQQFLRRGRLHIHRCQPRVERHERGGLYYEGVLLRLKYIRAYVPQPVQQGLKALLRRLFRHEPIPAQFGLQAIPRSFRPREQKQRLLPIRRQIELFPVEHRHRPCLQTQISAAFTTSPSERRPVSAWLQVRQRIRPPQAAPRMCRPR